MRPKSGARQGGGSNDVQTGTDFRRLPFLPSAFSLLLFQKSHVRELNFLKGTELENQDETAPSHVRPLLRSIPLPSSFLPPISSTPTVSSQPAQLQTIILFNQWSSTSIPISTLSSSVQASQDRAYLLSVYCSTREVRAHPSCRSTAHSFQCPRLLPRHLRTTRPRYRAGHGYARSDRRRAASAGRVC